MDVVDLISEADLPAVAEFKRFHPFIKGAFSQWHPTVFTLEGFCFVTAEQWMMCAKAWLFDDKEQARQIMATADPAEQKRLGQHVRNFDQDVWDRAKIGIVLRGNRAKFEQNAGALRQLKSTGDAMLVEANPRDWIWGVGLSIDDPRVHRPEEWRGANLLGRVLTKVRADLL